MLSYNLELEPLGPCSSEPLKQSKSSRSQMFSEIGSLKNFAIFAGKHLCWGLQTCNFFKKTPTKVSPVYIIKFFRTGFFIKHLQWMLLTVLPQYSKVSFGVSSLMTCLHIKPSSLGQRMGNFTTSPD